MLQTDIKYKSVTIRAVLSRVFIFFWKTLNPLKATLTYRTPLLKCIGRIHKDPFSLINNWAKRGEGNIFCWQNLWFTLVLLGHRQLFQENSYIADILLQWFCDKTKPHPLHRRTCLTLTLESNVLRDISCTENLFS